MGVAKKQCYDGSGFPKDLENFLDGLSDAKLEETILKCQPGRRGPCLSGAQYTHHIDQESSSSDGKWHLFSVAADSGGTKASLNAPIGTTPYLCHIGIAKEFFDDVPSNLATIIRAAFLHSKFRLTCCYTRYVLEDGTIHDDREKAVEAQKLLQAKKEEVLPTHAPSGKPFWNWEKWGEPFSKEHFNKYETRKDMQKDAQKDTQKDKQKNKQNKKDGNKKK